MDLDQVKLLFDHSRHLTSVSTASIVVLVTFLEKLSAKPELTWLVAVSLAGFGITIIASIVAQAGVINFADSKYDAGGRGTGAAFIAAHIFFVLATVSLAVFGFLNIGP